MWGGAFAASGHRAHHGQVGHDQVDGVGREAGAQMARDQAAAVGVLLLVVVGVLGHQRLRLDDSALRLEGEERDTGGLAAAVGEADDSALVGRCDGGGRGDVGQLQQGPHGGKAAWIVVVAGDDHDLRPGAGQAQQRVVDDLLRLRGGDGTVELVARHQHQVHRCVPCDRDDFVEDRPVLAGAVAAAQGPADVPVRGVEDLHDGRPGACHVVARRSPAVPRPPVIPPPDPRRGRPRPRRRRAPAPPHPAAWPTPGRGTPAPAGPAAPAATESWCRA